MRTTLLALVGTLLLPVAAAFGGVPPQSVDAAQEVRVPVVADLNTRLDAIGADMIGEMRVSQSANGQITIKADLSTSPTSKDAPQGRVQISAVLNPDVQELLVSPVLSLYRVENRLILVDRITWANGYDTVRVRDLTRNMVLLELDVLAENADSLGVGMFDRAAVSLSEGMRGGICEPSLLDCLNAAKEACSETSVATFSYTCNGETLEVTCSFTCREPAPQ